MQEIFKALRALRRRSENLGMELNLASLSTSLHCFERHNRGHQHELDELARHSCGIVFLNTPQQRWSRIRTFRETLGILVSGMARTPLNFLPQDPLFEAMWTARDSTGALRKHTLEHLTWLLRYSNKPPAYCTIHWVTAEWNEALGGLQATMTVRNRLRGGVSNPRVVRFECEAPDTLQASAQAMWRCKQAFAELLAQETWPEFNQSEPQVQPGPMAFAQRVARSGIF